MPKHAFKFPRIVIDAIKNHVQMAVQSTDASRFKQEPHYTTSLITRLEGTAYHGEHGYVSFKATAFDDRGRNSAERLWGCDFAISAIIADREIKVEKVILFQAKLGAISDMSRGMVEGLKKQIEKMRALVKAPKVMEIPSMGTLRDPRVISGNRILSGAEFKSVRLADYFVTRVTTTLDGTTSPHTIQMVRNSSLPQLGFTANLHR